MSNPFDEMRAGMAQAREQLHAADTFANQMAGILKGRLRHVDRYTLRDLKRELAHYNARTGKWS